MGEFRSFNVNGSSEGIRARHDIGALAQSVASELARLQISLQTLQEYPKKEPSLQSAAVIDALIARRLKRSELLGEGLFSDPAWDILLALYSARTWQRRETVGQLTITSGLPATTFLRWTQTLVERGLVRSESDHLDRRLRYLEITEQACVSMDRYFGIDDRSLLAA